MPHATDLPRRKTKGATPWARQYFHDRLVSRSHSSGSGEVSISALEDWDGDVELGNRKGRLITIYDCSFALAFAGKTSGGEDVAGKIRFPEVSHDVEDAGDEYAFDTELTKGGNAAQALYGEVRKEFVPSLMPVFKAFRDTLVASHAADLGHEEEAAKAAAGAMKAPTNKPPPMKEPSAQEEEQKKPAEKQEGDEDKVSAGGWGCVCS